MPNVTIDKAGGIQFCEAGHQSSGVPVICLHGIGGNHTSFSDQMLGLEQRRVIAWNMPGYYGSEMLAKMCFATLAASITTMMDKLGIASAHIVGQSIGGMIAQEIAIRTPERVTSLGLIATTPAFGGRDDSFKDAFIAARLGPLDDGMTMKALAHSAIPAIIGPAASPKMCASAIDAMAGINEAAFRQVISCLVTFNRRDDQHLIHHPCCLIAGSHDTNSPARVMTKMADGLPNATMHIIDQAGHLVNSEAPAAVNALLTSFFERVGNSTDG